MPSISLRLPTPLMDQIITVCKQERINVSIYFRQAVAEKLAGQQAFEKLDDLEKRLGIALNSLQGDQRTLFQALQFTQAMLDMLVKMFLAAVPKPDNTNEARALASARYQDYLNAVASSLAANGSAHTTQSNGRKTQ